MHCWTFDLQTLWDSTLVTSSLLCIVWELLYECPILGHFHLILISKYYQRSEKALLKKFTLKIIGTNQPWQKAKIPMWPFKTWPSGHWWIKEVTSIKENQVTMLGRLFMLDMKNTLDNKKSQNNRQVKRKGSCFSSHLIFHPKQRKEKKKNSYYIQKW